MSVLQQPRAVGLLFGSEQLDGFVHPLVGGIPGGAEVFRLFVMKRGAVPC
jgi:hypothetical protein